MPPKLKSPPDQLRDAIAERVAALDLSGAELARRSGVSQQHVADYLAGRADMTGRRLGRLLGALDLEIRVTR
jgi:transcriptional regulator with XRE-family HTH domain